jgi:general secretion pathway protein G
MGQNGLNSVSVCFSLTQTLKNIAAFRARKQKLSSGGFTLVELVISMAIIATLAAIAVPLTQDYIYKGNLAQAVTEIRLLEKEIVFFKMERGYYPGGQSGMLESLQEIGRDNFPDPWRTPYQYRNLENGEWAGGKPKFCRRDRSYNPLNYDFDLYSVGPDRQVPTHNQITKNVGADDIVRAVNGMYVGEGSKF